MKHIKELPVPLRQLRADVPGGVEHLVMQTLEKQPERRQSAMEEIASSFAELNECLKMRFLKHSLFLRLDR